MSKTAESLQDFIKKPNDFTEIILREKFTVEDCAKLAAVLKSNKTITVLSLTLNFTGDEGAASLAEMLIVNETITSLKLEFNNMSDEGAASLAKMLKVNKKITSVDFGFNRIGDKGAASLAEMLKVNETITSLRLEYNKIGDEGAASLAKVLEVNKTITSLYFRNNYIGAAGAASLAEMLKVNEIITSVDLGFNKIGDEGAASLAQIKEITNANKIRQEKKAAKAKAEHAKEKAYLEALQKAEKEAAENAELKIKLLEAEQKLAAIEEAKQVEKAAQSNVVNLAPVTDFGNKELLIQVTQDVVSKVMTSGNPAIIPLHMHGNHLTGLVIKKQFDGSLQVIYQDPKGDSLVTEKNAGALIKTIVKINSDLNIVDLKLKQQNNDDDCGPFSVENLVALAAINTSGQNRSDIQKLLIQPGDKGNADSISIKHVKLFNDNGIPVPEFVPAVKNPNAEEQLVVNVGALPLLPPHAETPADSELSIKIDVVGDNTDFA